MKQEGAQARPVQVDIIIDRLKREKEMLVNVSRNLSCKLLETTENRCQLLHRCLSDSIGMKKAFYRHQARVNWYSDFIICNCQLHIDAMLNASETAITGRCGIPSDEKGLLDFLRGN